MNDLEQKYRARCATRNYVAMCVIATIVMTALVAAAAVFIGE